MKKILCVFLVIFMSFSLFSQDLGRLLFDVIESSIEERREIEANKSVLLQTLEKNREKNVEIKGWISIDGFVFNDLDKTFNIPELKSDKFTIIAEIETEFLNERINYLHSGKVEITFVLKNSRPKTYAITKISGIETVDKYKARLESERLAKLEAERIAEEKRLEAERLAKIEAERIAEENRKKLEVGLPIYKNHLAKAKEYESQKRWCYALGSYYDALSIDFISEEKQEAIDSYSSLVKTILSGNPGLGSYNEFTIHDEWKNLLIDAEKFGCSFNPYEVTVGNLVKGDLDYTTKTASYSAPVSYKVGNRYKYTIEIIENGYKKAYKEDWKDLPKEWPKYSVSYKGNDIYNVDGVCIFAVKKDAFSNAHYNAFAVNNISHTEVVLGRNMRNNFKTLMDCKFNIVDENGREVVKPIRCLLGYEESVIFKGITPEVMDLIENGKAFINPINYYLQYGKYYSPHDFGGRALIKDFSEVKLPIDTAVFYNGENSIDKKYKSFCDAVSKSVNMVAIPNTNIEISETEVTQELYFSIMGKNPSESGIALNPVTNVSWFDAIKFCNKLSLANGLEPVYEIPSIYTEEFLKEKIDRNIEFELSKNPIIINGNATGYRLPNMNELESYEGWSNKYFFWGEGDELLDRNNMRLLRFGHDSVSFRLVRNIQ